MRITNEEIEELDMEFFLERESIPFRVGQGVSGVQLNIQKCPLCWDNRYRTYFGVETGVGNCFVCGEGFGRAKAVHGYMNHDNWAATFQAIGEILREQGWRPKRKAMVRVEVGEIELPLADPIPNENGENMLYLEERGISAEIAKYFELRHCQFGWWKFKDEEGVMQMQTFSNRIIIPVFDLDGTLKTFQGRDLSGLSDRKYLFPKQLPGTGRYLMNGHNCVASKRACMGEGFFDVAAIKIAFDEDVELRDVTALGSFGKHLSYGDPMGDDQLGRFNALKKRGLQEVTIMWDGETAALSAALDAGKKLSSTGLTVRIALLPYEKDPNEIPAHKVREAFYGAKLYTPSLDLKWRLQNPYASAASRQKHGL